MTAAPTGAAPAASGPARSPSAQSRRRFLKLSLGSVGVVFGDIGTSPLYALRESLHAVTEEAGFALAADIIGVVSLLLWTLIIVVSLKYVLIILSLDNRGEGGTLTLHALAERAVGRTGFGVVFFLGLLGAAFFYGDAIITPAISVLSAVEGLSLVTPVFEPFVVPIALGILIGLFLIQSKGTGRVGTFFGPITAVYFLVLAALGLWHIADDPTILHALNPVNAVGFLARHGAVGFVVMGAVFLAVTGAEALYADMGHFGRGPIRFAWTVFVFPALILNYLGQGGMLLSHPEALGNPFFLMVNETWRLPLVLLATVATVIASQAVITGAFSLTAQAIQLGLLPRLAITHTSETQHGQIYMPQVNYMLLVAVVLLVLAFGSSSSLASAYGIAVTAEMVVTTALAFIVFNRLIGWPVWKAAAVLVPLLVIDVAFFTANSLKILDGGYVPILVSLALVVVMWTWARGVALITEHARREDISMDDFARMMGRARLERVAGSAIFLTSDVTHAPRALLHNIKHNKVLHERNVLLEMKTGEMPRVPDPEKLSADSSVPGFTRITATFGYMEHPSVPKVLALARKAGFEFNMMDTSFFIGRHSLRSSGSAGMPLWQDNLFLTLYGLAANANEYYRIPPNRAVELGGQMVI